MLEDLKKVLDKVRHTGPTTGSDHFYIAEAARVFLAKHGDALIAAVERESLAHEIALAARELREFETERYPVNNNAQIQHDVALDAATDHLDTLLARYAEEA